MKNRLLPLFVVLGSFSAYSQVGVGTKTPHESAQLEVFAKDKGILIPNIPLQSLTDNITIKNAKESLLVFNTTTNSELKPGYYYWFDNRWNRMSVGSDSGSTGKDTGVGVAEGTGVPGSKGTPNYPGENINIYTDTASGIVYVQLSNGTWNPINGKDGKDGIIGGTGAPGTTGANWIRCILNIFIKKEFWFFFVSFCFF
jgi:hypothetical protein